MRQQPIVNSSGWFSSFLPTNHSSVFFALIFSALLTACGGGDGYTKDSSPEPGLDGTPPTLTKVTLTNADTSCATAKLGDDVAISIVSSESIMKPTVTIGGQAAEVEGQANKWTATQTMVAGIDDGALAFDIAFSDNSGETGTNVTASTIASNEDAEKPEWASVEYCADGSCVVPCFTTKVFDFEHDDSVTLAWKDIGIVGNTDRDPGTLSSIVPDPSAGASRGNVAKSSIEDGGASYAGAYFIARNAGDGELAFKLNMSTNDAVVSVDMYGHSAGLEMWLKLEDVNDSGKSVVASTYTQGDGTEWETLYFDFSDPVEGRIDTTVVYGAFFLMYGGNTGGKPAATWYWDNITHGNVTSDGPVAPPSEFAKWGAFGGATADGDTYAFPTSTTENPVDSWAGFSNSNKSLYPFSFPLGGKITFKAAVPAGGLDTTVKFKFEKDVHPDVDPSFEVDPVVVSGETEKEYTVEFAARPDGETYKSLLMYIVERDSSVVVKDVKVTPKSATTANSNPYAAWGEFGGMTVDGNTYTFPAGAEGWGGFANTNTALYPFNFENGGTVTFTGAAVGADTSVKFQFENKPHPENTPNFATDPVVVSGTTEATYSATIPAQSATQDFSSFIMYIVERDQAVTVKNVKVTAN